MKPLIQFQPLYTHFWPIYSFEESLVYSVSLGGDTDTIGAMCGAIAGAWYGVESIPAQWKEALENREFIENVAEELWNVFYG